MQTDTAGTRAGPGLSAQSNQIKLYLVLRKNGNTSIHFTVRYVNQSIKVTHTVSLLRSLIIYRRMEYKSTNKLINLKIYCETRTENLFLGSLQLHLRLINPAIPTCFSNSYYSPTVVIY